MKPLSEGLNLIAEQLVKAERMPSTHPVQDAGLTKQNTQLTTTEVRTAPLDESKLDLMLSLLEHVRPLLTWSVPSLIIGKTQTSPSDYKYSFTRQLDDREIKAIQSAARLASPSVIGMHLTRLAASRPVFNATPKEMQIRIEDMANDLKGYSELAIIEGIKIARQIPKDRYFPMVDELREHISWRHDKYATLAKGITNL